MNEPVTLPEYLQAIDTITRFEEQFKKDLTVDEFLVWFEKTNLNANPSRLARALSILKTTKGKTRIFSVSGKDLKPFAGFAKSYGRGLFEIQREIFFEQSLEKIKSTTETT
jgi:hypothetical protein